MRKDGKTGYQALKDSITRKNNLLKASADLIAKMLDMKPSPLKISGSDILIEAMQIMTKCDDESQR